MIIGIITLFVLIFGFGAFGVYITWHDFDKPKGIKFSSHIFTKNCIRHFLFLLIMWLITCAIIIIFGSCTGELKCF